MDVQRRQRPQRVITHMGTLIATCIGAGVLVALAILRLLVVLVG